MSKEDILGEGFELKSFGIRKGNFQKIALSILSSGVTGIGFFYILSYGVSPIFLHTYFPGIDDGEWFQWSMLVAGLLGGLLTSFYFIYKRNWAPAVYSLIAGPIIVFLYILVALSIACSMGNCL